MSCDGENSEKYSVMEIIMRTYTVTKKTVNSDYTQPQTFGQTVHIEKGI